MKNYTPPKIPTLASARENPALLKNLPRRWQKTAVAACIGIIALSGCTYQDETYFTDVPYSYSASYRSEEEIRIHLEAAQVAYAAARAQLDITELELHTHFGGSGAGPFYVVSFTEQEAFGFIRSKLEAEGFYFSAAPPDYSVNVPNVAWDAWTDYVDIGLIWYDAHKRVGITQQGGWGPHRAFAQASDIIEAFAEKGISVNIIRNPGNGVFDGLEHRWNLFPQWVEQNVPGFTDYWEWSRALRDEEGGREEYARLLDQFDLETGKAETIALRSEEERPNLIKNLEDQAQNIINRSRTR